MATTGNFKDSYDIRDYQVNFRQITPAPPTRVDLRTKHAIHVYNQGQPPTCTAHAVLSAFEILQNGSYVNAFMPSRSFVYYNTRVLEGTVAQLSGTSIRNAIKTLSTTGVCDETVWPYEVARLLVRPPAHAFAQAPVNKTTKYARLTLSISQVRLCLWSGHPFVFGMRCHDHWYRAAGGVIPVVTPATAKPIGGHAMVCVGYNDATQTLIVLNSWGATWGDKGYAHVPYSLFLREAYDAWVLFGVTVPVSAVLSAPSPIQVPKTAA